MNSNVISVYAPAHMDPYDSYGLIACELVRHLSHMGWRVNAIANGYPNHKNQDEELSKLTKLPIIAAVGGILLGYPTSYENYGPFANAGPKIAVTMFESTKIPEEWILPLNKCDAVIVPSVFCHDVFVECGVTSPVLVFPLGILESYEFAERSNEDPFTFLTFMDRGKRKGGLHAILAFSGEFGTEKDVRLVIKSREIPEERKFSFNEDNIEVIFEDYSIDRMIDLYGKCHCLINPNLGEGFGLIPREFSATGGISLSSNWGGTADLIDLWGWPIECSTQKADWSLIPKFKNLDLGNWADPSIDHIRSSIRNIVENREMYLQEAKIKSKLAKMYYSWNNFATNVSAVWRSINGS